MRLTQENAHLYEGRVLDARWRLFQHYPLIVGRNRLGEPVIIDRTGTHTRIPAEKDLFGAVWFDFVFTLPSRKMRLREKMYLGEKRRMLWRRGTAGERRRKPQSIKGQWNCGR